MRPHLETKQMLRFGFMCALLAPLLFSCANANFKGGSAGPATQNDADAEKSGSPEPLASRTPTPGTGGSSDTGVKKECDLTKDFVDLKYPPDIQKCVDSGKLYDYHEKKCFDLIEKATSYKCTKVDVKAAVGKLSLGSTKLGLEDYPAAKLIGCGERRGGKTVLLQWWVPPSTGIDKEKCTFTGNMVIGTECYVSQDAASGGGSGSASNTAEAVSACARSN